MASACPGCGEIIEDAEKYYAHLKECEKAKALISQPEELEKRIAPDSTAAVLDHAVSHTIGPGSSDAGFLE